MKQNSLLAAVHAATKQPAAIPAGGKQEQPMDTKPTLPAADAGKPITFTNAADLAAAFPALATELRTDGATAERTRILGIEAHATPGHEALIASMKADPAVTPDMAAGRILAADRKQRSDELGAINDVEIANKAVQPAPAANGNGGAAPKFEQTEAGWAAEFDATDSLKAEFASKGDYVAFKKAEADGRAKRFLRKTG